MDVKDGIIIAASFVKELDKAWLLNCEGDQEWFPKSLCNFDPIKGELEAPKWLLRQKFPDEKF